jgi:hypothetical protein
MAAPSDGDEWRFSVEEFEDEEPAEAANSESETGTERSNIAGEFGPSETIEPGEVDAESAFFVLVGVFIGLLFVAAAVVPAL